LYARHDAKVKGGGAEPQSRAQLQLILLYCAHDTTKRDPTMHRIPFCHVNGPMKTVRGLLS
jgi:hypothetical protein